MILVDGDGRTISSGKGLATQLELEKQRYLVLASPIYAVAEPGNAVVALHSGPLSSLSVLEPALQEVGDHVDEVVRSFMALDTTYTGSARDYHRLLHADFCPGADDLNERVISALHERGIHSKSIRDIHKANDSRRTREVLVMPGSGYLYVSSPRLRNTVSKIFPKPDFADGELR